MSEPDRPRVAAAVDIGSNSAHLLVARAAPAETANGRARLATLVDRSDLLGLGDGVDNGGAIPADRVTALVDSLRGFRDVAEAAGAERFAIIGTHPLRRATNAAEVVAALERELGAGVDVISARQEALLTFVGVSGGSLPPEPMAVVDIGGGSTEVGLHIPGRPLEVIALHVGSARLTSSFVSHDPPTDAEIAALHAGARELIDAAVWPEFTPGHVRELVFVGGTATNVARMGSLDRGHLELDLGIIRRLPAAEVVERFRVRPLRARQLAAGVAIVGALLDRFGVDRAAASEASLRDGAIIAWLRLGADWLVRLDELA